MNRNGLRRAAHPELLVEKTPRRRVEGTVDLDMAVAVQRRDLPDDRIPARRREWQQRVTLAFLEELDRLPARCAVPTLRRDLHDPTPQRLAVLIDVDGVVRLEEVAFHVAAVALDLALLLGRARWRRVDLEAEVPGELAVRAVDRRIAVDAEGCAGHRGLQVVRHDDARDAAEELEGVHVQVDPRLDLLVEDELAEHHPAEAQRHHEEPGLAQHAALGVVALAGVDEVDLGNLAGCGLDRNRYVGRLRPRLAIESLAHALHCREAACVLGLVEP